MAGQFAGLPRNEPLVSPLLAAVMAAVLMKLHAAKRTATAVIAVENRLV